MMTPDEAAVVINNQVAHYTLRPEPECRMITLPLEAVRALLAGYQAATRKDKPLPPKMIYGVTYCCPPDCGGSEFDEHGYIPHCPTCGKSLDIPYLCDRCTKCGQLIGKRGPEPGREGSK